MPPQEQEWSRRNVASIIICVVLLLTFIATGVTSLKLNGTRKQLLATGTAIISQSEALFLQRDATATSIVSTATAASENDLTRITDLQATLTSQASTISDNNSKIDELTKNLAKYQDVDCKDMLTGVDFSSGSTISKSLDKFIGDQGSPLTSSTSNALQSGLNAVMLKITTAKDSYSFLAYLDDPNSSNKPLLYDIANECILAR